MKRSNTNNKYKLREDTLLKYHQIMQLYADGLSFRDVALLMDMSRRSLESISLRLLEYYKVNHLGQLVAVLMRKGIIK